MVSLIDLSMRKNEEGSRHAERLRAIANDRAHDFQARIEFDDSDASTPPIVLKDERFWDFHNLLLQRGQEPEDAYQAAIGRAEQEAEMRARGYTGFDTPRRLKQRDTLSFGRPEPRKDKHKPAELPTFRASRFAGKPVPPREYFVPGLIPQGKVTLLTGDGGTGKSLLALMLGASSALGDQWLDMPVSEGVVLVLSAEDDLDEVHRRLASIVGEDRLGALDRMHIAPLVDIDPVLSAPDRATGRMAETELFADLKRKLEAMKPRLLILDTLADLFGGDEIKRDQARGFISLLNRLTAKFGTTIVLLSHPSQSGMETGRGTSGSTAWSNSVRSRLYLQQHETDPDMRVLTLMKTNNSRPGRKILMRWQDGFFERVDEHQQRADDLGEGKREFLRLLEEFARQGRAPSPSKSQTYAPALFAKQPGVVVPKKKLEDAMNALLANDTIKIVEVGPPSRRTKHLTLAEASSAEEARFEDDLE